ncbi:J domain-containing protein [Sphingomonas bacterium]|uniref:J domain-containing protein n=1 Tax=Sphingomonas bacterium TaxID=1895847 RepID=UPI001575E739|nr:J domain-containing protein [Sphingomonas bacterium]
MPRATRTNDWGFPRWRPYGAERDAVKVRLCDRHGCDQPGTCPAPKSPNSPERWWFCAQHAGEYNRGWDYFAGLSAEEAARREAADARTQDGYANARHYAWAGSGDGTRTQDELRALAVFGLEPDATFEATRAAWRTHAKENHPDVAGADPAAAERFRQGQAAWDVLRAAEEGREAVGKRQ